MAKRKGMSAKSWALLVGAPAGTLVLAGILGAVLFGEDGGSERGSGPPQAEAPPPAAPQAPAAKTSEAVSAPLAGGVLEVSTLSLPKGVFGEPYEVVLAASGVPAGASAAWSVAAGRLPPGLVLDASTGRISGVPTERAVERIVLAASVSGVSATRPVDFEVGAKPPVPDLPNLSEAVLGRAYSGRLTAKTTPRTDAVGWSLDSERPDALPPPGISLSASGEFVGAPQAVGSYAFVAVATDLASKTSAKVPVVLRVSAAAGSIHCEGTKEAEGADVAGGHGHCYFRYSPISTDKGSFSVTGGSLRLTLSAWGAGGAAGSPQARPGTGGGAGAAATVVWTAPAGTSAVVLVGEGGHGAGLASGGGGGGGSFVLQADGTVVLAAGGGGGGALGCQDCGGEGGGGGRAGKDGGGRTKATVGGREGAGGPSGASQGLGGAGGGGVSSEGASTSGSNYKVSGGGRNPGGFGGFANANGVGSGGRGGGGAPWNAGGGGGGWSGGAGGSAAIPFQSAGGGGSYVPAGDGFESAKVLEGGQGGADGIPGVPPELKGAPIGTAVGGRSGIAPASDGGPGFVRIDW